ncbi:MAG: oligosaccharide flippase family protein, partial [Elusimicrobia bacterium]|nr:oligosaccharide flippase family protein [Elusimicrobiota bacterium]
LNLLMIREISTDKASANRIFVNSFIIRFLLSLAAIAAIFVIMIFLNKPTDVIYSVALFSGGIICNSFILSFTALFRAFEKMIYEGIVSVLLVLGYVGLGILTVINTHSIVWVAASYFISSACVVLICSIIVLRKFFIPQISFSTATIKQLICTVWPFGLGMVFILGLSRINVIIISVVLGDQETGWFQSVYSIVGSINLILGMIIAAFFPRLTILFKDSVDSLRTQAGKLCRNMIIMLFPLVLFSSYMSKIIVQFVYGSEYAMAGIILSIVIWTVIPFFVANLLGNIMIAAKLERIFAFSAIGIFCAGLLLYGMLLPRFGIYGGAYAALIIDTFMAILFLIWLLREGVIHIKWREVAKLFCIILGTSMILVGGSVLSRIAAGICALIFYGGTLYAMGLLNKQYFSLSNTFQSKQEI